MFASESTDSFSKLVVGVQFNPTPDPNPDQTKRARVVLLQRNVFVTPSQLQLYSWMHKSHSTFLGSIEKKINKIT